MAVLDHCKTWRLELLLQTTRPEDNAGRVGAIRNNGRRFHHRCNTSGLVKCATPVAHQRGVLSPAFIVNDLELAEILEQHFDRLWQLSCNERLLLIDQSNFEDKVESLFNRFRDEFPAACCVLLVCCLATPIPRSLLRGFLFTAHPEDLNQSNVAAIAIPAA